MLLLPKSLYTSQPGNFRKAKDMFVRQHHSDYPMISFAIMVVSRCGIPYETGKLVDACKRAFEGRVVAGFAIPC